MDVRVFDAWRGEPWTRSSRSAATWWKKGDYAAAARWREAGGKVLGHFQVYFPCEIAHAAGLLPLKVRGGPRRAHPGRVTIWLLPVLDPQDLPRTGAAGDDPTGHVRLASDLRCRAQLGCRVGSKLRLPVPDLYLPQNANSKGSVEYLTAEYRRLAAAASEISGTPVTEAALRKSVTLYNKSRALVRQLYQIKCDTPWLIAPEDAYALVAVGGFIPVEEHIDLLNVVLPALREREAKSEDRIRVVLEGAFCEQPPPRLDSPRRPLLLRRR